MEITVSASPEQAFAQVEAYEANHRLLLTARMKLPGRAWLEFRVDGKGSNSVIRQTAVFDPRGRR